ncbi:hypothetical protein [Herbaspirillum huttiense]|uniref:hypothetical protein n=3 Tax=Bacteria TaxID=2 RepID=UPI002E79D2D8|nr:hypothetical protein [Herbaspirillum huttiense]MEE1636369.1 hypothetical protein [Herbaspirillum huttiense NC40101]
MNSEPSLTSTSAAALPIHWIESLFQRMTFAYGAKFADQWKGIDPEGLKRHWAEKLAGLTGEQLKAGVAKLDTLDWPPSLPQFIRLCKPTVEAVAAYYEALAGIEARKRGEMGKWSHPAIFWAATPMAYDFDQMTYSQIKHRWERALDEQLDKGEWRDIPKPVLALPEPGKTGLSREKAAQLVKDYGAEGVVKSATSKTDHKYWARKIKARQKRGDKSLTLIQIKFADEALAGAEA